MSLMNELITKGVVRAPSFLKTNTMYECYMGSVAYGVSNDTSDVDVYGYAIPSKEVLFPHLYGHIRGFGNAPNFEQYQQHHIQYKEKEYDVCIYSIVKYFRLVSQGNPNMIDSLFVPRNMIRHSTQTAELVRENRHLFLSKLCYPAFKGYAYSQLSKAKNKTPIGAKELIKFEQEKGIDRATKMSDVEKELRKRNIKF